MSEKVYIMVETNKKETPEYVFVDTLCNKSIGQGNYKIVYTDGYVNFKPTDPKKDDKKQQTKKREVRGALEKYSKFLILFDADKKDFEERKTGIKKWMKDYENTIGKNKKLDYEIFLFPNDKDPGNFETLLKRITNDKYRKIFCCLDAMEKCLSDENIYYSSNPKEKMYVYITCLAGNTGENIKKIKKGDYSFENIGIYAIQIYKNYRIS